MKIRDRLKKRTNLQPDELSNEAEDESLDDGIRNPARSQRDEEHRSSSVRSSSITLTRRNELADAFEKGVTTSDQWYKVRKYPNCFVGNEAIDYMVHSGIATSRREALDIGNMLMRDMNLFEHVHRNHKFEDDFLFYRFVKKKNRFIAIQDEIAALAYLGGALYGQDDDSSTRNSVYVRSLTEIAQIFEGAVSVGDHRYRLRLYRNAFVGRDAVDVLVSYGLATSREDAVLLGRRLAKQLNLFNHVSGSHEFKDSYLFYRFTPASNRRPPPEVDGADTAGGRTENLGATRTVEPLSLEDISALFEREMPVQTHRYRMKEYPKTFVANEAVDFLVRRNMASSRSDAVHIGRVLSEELNLFQHVLNDRPFSDDNLFFQFTPLKSRRQREHQKRSSVSFDDLSQVAIAFRQGVKVKRNFYRLKSYSDTFIGSEAVDFLVNSSLAPSRKYAVHLGRTLARQYNLFHHVSQEWEFCDDYKFFRFAEEDGGVSSELSSIEMTQSQIAPEKIAEALRSGVEVKDRSYRLRMYKNCFLGCEAIDYLVGARFAATRQEAIDLGRSLAREFDLFHHVARDHELEDAPLFYSFSNHGEIHPLSTSAVPLTTLQLKDIAKQFEENVHVKSNRHNLRVYHNTFVGREGVDHLVSSGSAKSRQEAVLIGRALCEKFHLFTHVTMDHKFSDRELFYRFLPESQRRSWSKEEKESPDVFLSIPKFGVITSDEDWRNRVQAFETKIMSRSSLLFLPETDLGRLNYSSDQNLGREERLKRWAHEFRRSDPRYQILNFFNDVAQEGADKIEETRINPELLRPLLRYFARASVFTVWRPTSFDAIRKMILGDAVGKGLDIKGKSAQRGKLSGFVPFLQISENRHKTKIRTLPKHGVVRLFFSGKARRNRDIVASNLESVARDMIDCVEMAKHVLASNNPNESAREDALACMLLDMTDPTIAYIEDYAPQCLGLEIPVRLFWEAYYVRQDINRDPGSEYDTGRPSQPAFQDMNFAALHSTPKKDTPRAVLYHYAGEDAPMSPFDILMAYEENSRVMPVVSDFDCFLMGSRGVSFSQELPPDQVDILKWCVKKTESILDDSNESASWTSRWLAVLKEAANNGFHPRIPRYGFGDPKTYSLMEQAIRRLKDQGSVRHGAECFNFFFPQTLDNEFLIVSEGIAGQTLPWKYVDVEGLQTFLCEKIQEGYTFPLNPKWILCDPGWKNIYDELFASNKSHVQESLNVWYPVDSGVREHIECIHRRHPGGFKRQDNGMITIGNTRLSGTGSMDLALEELKLKHKS